MINVSDKGRLAIVVEGSGNESIYEYDDGLSVSDDEVETLIDNSGKLVLHAHEYVTRITQETDNIDFFQIRIFTNFNDNVGYAFNNHKDTEEMEVTDKDDSSP